MVKDWINIQRPLFGVFLETHIHSSNEARIRSAIPVGWKFFGNYGQNISGRIVVVWDPSVSVFIYKASAQAVTCGIHILAQSLTFTVTFVYGFNEVGERMALWKELEQINRTPAMSNSPWAVIGDFNQILRLSHHSGYPTRVIDDDGMEDMNIALQDSELFEAQSKGAPFTWWNNNEVNPISKRIDHALINQLWATRFPDSYADFLDPGQSDHSPYIRALLTRPDPVAAREEHQERATLNILLNAEQKFYRQKSRVRWADVGDRNTTFYHQ
ncbi:hypothetical protein YC2023_085074 [Brassica napus]